MIQRDPIGTRSIPEIYRSYVESARAHEREGRVDAAWAGLEAAHILGQQSTRLHVGSHAAMLGLAWRTRSGREIVAQIVRLAAATLATWLWVPVGNTGRANVSALARMPLPRDLEWIAEGRGRGSESSLPR
jgi:Protein of unknown function (DUF3703)